MNLAVLFENNDIPNLLDLLQITNDNNLRNEIVLFLADNQVQESVPIIVRLIKELSTSNYIGTLVYALQYLDSHTYLVEIVFLFNLNNYEAKAMLYDLLLVKINHLDSTQLLALYNQVQSLKRFKGKKRILNLLSVVK